ncbi:hypothetical protein ACQKM9_20605 [Viridibacillus sp. NPDC093762]|uniref:hypothetical protein n=1 Tax=Viridibacillus sp. NPDC093762 TaxID=3390720 RepID=UPI003CFD354F
MKKINQKGGSSFVLICDFWHFSSDLSYVLANKAKQFKGDREIVIFDIIRGGHTEANFGKNSIMFLKDYQRVEEGNYYCEVEYYPGTKHGKSLKIYQSIERD